MAEQAGHPVQHKHPTLWEKPLSPLTAAEETTGHCLSASHDLSSTLSFCSLTLFGTAYTCTSASFILLLSFFFSLLLAFPHSTSIFFFTISLHLLFLVLCHWQLLKLNIKVSSVLHSERDLVSKWIAGWSPSKAYALNLSNITAHYQLKIRMDAVCLVPAQTHD